MEGSRGTPASHLLSAQVVLQLQGVNGLQHVVRAAVLQTASSCALLQTAKSSSLPRLRGSSALLSSVFYFLIIILLAFLEGTTAPATSWVEMGPPRPPVLAGRGGKGSFASGRKPAARPGRALRCLAARRGVDALAAACPQPDLVKYPLVLQTENMTQHEPVGPGLATGALKLHLCRRARVRLPLLNPLLAKWDAHDTRLCNALFPNERDCVQCNISTNVSSSYGREKLQ